jgi:beta-glucosidase-like glycosyl hydrolase
MRLEGEHAGAQAEPGGGVANPFEDGAVASVHAIEIADGERTRLAQRAGWEIAKDLHALKRESLLGPNLQG